MERNDVTLKFRQITDMNTYHYKGKVYDLTVDSAHSYNVNNFVVHNSGAGSLVNYALGVTQINPLEYDLIFERFLNPDRGHLPEQYWALNVNASKSGVYTF